MQHGNPGHLTIDVTALSSTGTVLVRTAAASHPPGGAPLSPPASPSASPRTSPKAGDDKHAGHDQLPPLPAIPANSAMTTVYAYQIFQHQARYLFIATEADRDGIPEDQTTQTQIVSTLHKQFFPILKLDHLNRSKSLETIAIFPSADAAMKHAEQYRHLNCFYIVVFALSLPQQLVASQATIAATHIHEKDLQQIDVHIKPFAVKDASHDAKHRNADKSPTHRKPQTAVVETKKPKTVYTYVLGDIHYFTQWHTDITDTESGFEEKRSGGVLNRVITDGIFLENFLDDDKALFTSEKEAFEHARDRHPFHAFTTLTLELTQAKPKKHTYHDAAGTAHKKKVIKFTLGNLVEMRGYLASHKAHHAASPTVVNKRFVSEKPNNLLYRLSKIGPFKLPDEAKKNITAPPAIATEDTQTTLRHK